MNMKTVHASDYGIFPNRKTDSGALIRTMLHKEGDDVYYLFDKGLYIISQFESVQKDLYLSNTDDVNPKSIGVLLENFRNVIFDGCGSTFIAHGQMTVMAILSCSNVTIKNCVIDWDIPLLAEGTIVDSSNCHVDLLIDNERYPFTVRNNTLYFKGEDWEAPYSGFTEFDAATGKVAYLKGDTFSSTSQQQLESDLVRFYGTFSPIPVAGNFGVIRHSNRIHPCILIENSSNTELNTVTLHHAAGLGFLAQFSNDLRFIGVDILPNSNAGRRALSGHDDGFHLSNNRGHILIENCKFYGLMDDSVNLHGTSVAIIRTTDAHTLEGYFGNYRSNNFGLWAKCGDQIALLNRETMLEEAVYTVTDFKLLNRTHFTISVKENIVLKPGLLYSAENTSATASLTCKNNFFGSGRARGLLVTTRQSVLIENNTFESSGSAILLAGDCNSWYECGCCRDVIIKNNEFRVCCIRCVTFENFPGTAPAYGLRRARAPAPLYLPAVSNLFLQFADNIKYNIAGFLFYPHLFASPLPQTCLRKFAADFICSNDQYQIYQRIE